MDREKRNIIYTGLKGLHKNGRSAKKNDGDSGTSWFDALSSRKQRLFRTGDKGSTKNRSRIVKLTAVIARLRRPGNRCRSTNSIRLRDRCNIRVIDNHRSNKVRTILKLIYIHWQKQRLYFVRVDDTLETYLYDWKLNSTLSHIMYYTF